MELEFQVVEMHGGLWVHCNPLAYIGEPLFSAEMLIPSELADMVQMLLTLTDSRFIDGTRMLEDLFAVSFSDQLHDPGDAYMGTDFIWQSQADNCLKVVPKQGHHGTEVLISKTGDGCLFHALMESDYFGGKLIQLANILGSAGRKAYLKWTANLPVTMTAE